MDAAIIESGEPAGAQNAIDLASPVIFHSLTFLDEGDEVTVGRQDIDSYCVLPADGAALLRELASGVPPLTAGQWFADTYGQPVDIAEFLAAMEEMGFVAADGTAPLLASPVRWQRLGEAMFSPVAWIGYTAFLALAVVLMARDHTLIPQYRNVFFTQYITVISIVLYIGQFPFILLHETFHAVSGRRLGLRTRLGISRRLYFVVAETTMDGLVTVPRRKRYLPILAGLLADLLVIAGLTLIAAALRRPDGAESLAGQICLALAFATLLRFLWQFYFYLQTDIYYAVVTVMGCVDLQKAAKKIFANRIYRIVRPGRVSDESLLHPTDRAVGRWYSWLLVVGYGFSLGTLAIFGIPTMIRIVRIEIGHMVDNPGLAGMTDAIVFLLLNVAQFGFIGYVLARDRRRRRTLAAAATTHVID